MENQTRINNKIAGIIFIGIMFIGIGVGKYIGESTVGTLVGMGVGFLASAIYRSSNK